MKYTRKNKKSPHLPDDIPEISEVIKSLEETDTASEHPELFHYTNISSLQGMIDTGELWAANAFQQNDTSELSVYWDNLLEYMNEPFLNAYQKANARSGKTIDFSKVPGGLEEAAKHDSRAWVNAARSILLAKPGGPGMFHPFIACFTTHSSDSEIDKYRQKNGMLSQWRAYAADGVAVVFDSKRLIEMLREETEKFEYGPGMIGDITYSHKMKKFSTLNKYLSGLAWLHAFDEEQAGQAHLVEAAKPLIGAALRTKHMGFLEENENRFVALLPSNQHLEEIKENRSLKNKKKIHINNGRAYIHLFEESSHSLPIKRVIIGPSRSQNEIADRVRWILGNEDLVHLSDTPFVPPNRSTL